MAFFPSLFKKSMDFLYAPVVGTAIPLSQVPDPVFAEEMLGKGIAIEPAEGKVYAPCDATVDIMCEFRHAVTLVTDFGAEIMIHIGLDTVMLRGKHFTVHAASGNQVKKGDLLISFDMDALKEAGYLTVTSMLVCNWTNYATFKTNVGNAVTTDDVVIELKK